MKIVLIYLSITLILASCVTKEREAELIKEIEFLKSSLDSCQNGADKLLAKIKLEYQDKNYQGCINIFSILEAQHPESNEYAQAKTYNSKAKNILKQRELQAKRKAEAEEKKKLAALKKLKKKYDDVSGITWYYNPYFTHYNNSNHTSLYIGDDGSKAWLRLVMSYEGDDWIFFEKAYLSYDGKTQEILFDKYDNKKTDHDGGSTWEWIDVNLSSTDKAFIERLVQGKTIKMRLSGKYTQTRNLNWNERQGLNDVLTGYSVLREKYKNL